MSQYVARNCDALLYPTDKDTCALIQFFLSISDCCNSFSVGFAFPFSFLTILKHMEKCAMSSFVIQNRQFLFTATNRDATKNGIATVKICCTSTVMSPGGIM